MGKARISLNRVERGIMALVHSGPLNSGDVLRVEVIELAGRQGSGPTVRIVRISEGGDIGAPFLGQTRIAGFTESEAEQELNRAYKAAEMPTRVASVLRLRAAAPAPPVAQLPPWLDPNNANQPGGPNSRSDPHRGPDRPTARKGDGH